MLAVGQEVGIARRAIFWRFLGDGDGSAAARGHLVDSFIDGGCKDNPAPRAPASTTPIGSIADDRNRPTAGRNRLQFPVLEEAEACVVRRPERINRALGTCEFLLCSSNEVLHPDRGLLAVIAE